MSRVESAPAGRAAKPAIGDMLLNNPISLGVLALVALYVAVMSGHLYSIDGLLMFRQAASIVQDFSLQFSTPVHWGDEFTTSRYGIGLSLFYLPGVALASAAGVHVLVPTAAAYDWDLFYRDMAYSIGGAPVHILVAAATAFCVARFVRELGYSSRTALLALGAYGVASPAIVYARGDFAQPLLGLGLIVAIIAAHRYRARGRRGALLAAAATLVLAVLTRPVEGSLLLPALVLLIVPGLRPATWNARHYRAVAVIGLAYAIAVALTLLINWGRFGSPFNTGYTGQINWSTPIWIGVPGVLVSPARGIVWQFPLILLAPLGFQRLRQAGFERLAVVMAGLVVLLFLNTALWVPWWGAWSWGSRLFVPAWPLVAVFAAIGVTALRPFLRGWLPAFLVAGGVLWAIPAVATDLLGGYAAAYDGTADSFKLSGYPPIGAWTFLHHIRAADMGDSSALDIFWFRIARRTHSVSILVPVVMTLAAAGLAFMAFRVERARGEKSHPSLEEARRRQVKG